MSEIEKIEKQISEIAQTLDCKFVLKGTPIPYSKVFSANGLLPAIMRRADQLCSFCMGYGLGLNFEQSDEAMSGVTVSMDENTPTALRLLCVADVIVEMVQQAPSPDNISVDSLMND